jgi:hypothetical protein
MTSSARPSSVIGNVSPSALAVLRLMISSTFVDCWIAAPHHVASHNFAWQTPIHAENDATRTGKFSNTALT